MVGRVASLHGGKYYTPLPCWATNVTIYPAGGNKMKWRQDKMRDSPTCKQQKTAKEEVVPNSLLSLLMETLMYWLHCICRERTLLICG
jgi:hypothetical protein